MSQTAAVILAAGSGRRMGSDVPKQFLPLCGRPVLCWTLEAFEKSGVGEAVLVVSDEEARMFCKKIIDDYGYQKVSAIVFGGAERYDSVWQGLLCLANGGDEHGHARLRLANGGDERGNGRPEVVAIHDGARCLVTPEVIDATFADARTHGAAVAAMPVKDTIKVVGADGFVERTIDRRTLWQMQTPQTFLFDEVFEAYEGLMKLDGQPAVTDDAEVVELLTRKKVFLTEGSYENFKITTPEDMILAEAILRKRMA